MKIEDLYYDMPDNKLDEENFDIETWRRTNPIDYFKALYAIFSSSKIAVGLPSEIAENISFQTIYRITRLYIPDVLYKYGSLTDDVELNEVKFKTLQNQQIFMSDIENFNDPFDGRAFYYNSQELNHICSFSHDGRIIDDFTKYNKATSLTENGVNCMPMWAHYSNNHHGFCVAYDMKDKENLSMYSCTFPVQYTDQRLDITSFMKNYFQKLFDKFELQKHEGFRKISLSDISLIYVSQLLCNIKHISWQYEKEFRCTMAANAKEMPYVAAVPKAIYIGMKCTPNNEKKLRSIAEKLQIPAYKMVFEECSENYDLEISY